jgi:hypothetical protein
VPPRERPSTSVEVKMGGVSDPACASLRRPRGRQRGRSRPGVSVEDVLGRACRGPEIACRIDARIELGSELEVNVICALASLLFSRMEPRIHRHGFPDIAMTLGRVCLAVAPVPIFRERLGASRLRSLTLTATRP